MQLNMRDTDMTSPLEKLYDCMVTGTLSVISANTEQALNQIRLTDNEKEILKKFSCKLFWCMVLEQYIENKILFRDKEKAFLKMAIAETKDPDLVIKLNEFFNNINKDEAKNLLEDIYRGIPKDALKDLFHKIFKCFNFEHDLNVF